MKLSKYYMTAENLEFEVISTYVPNEDNDTWIEYCNTKTKQKYTCRLEAFLSRFYPKVD